MNKLLTLNSSHVRDCVSFQMPYKMSVFEVRVRTMIALEVFLTRVSFDVNFQVCHLVELFGAHSALIVWRSVVDLVSFHSVDGSENFATVWTWN